MTVKRSYDCDLCRNTDYSRTLIGIYWIGDDIEVRPYKTVEHQICTKCIESIKNINIQEATHETN